MLCGLPLFLFCKEAVDATLTSETTISSSEVALTGSTSRDNVESRLLSLIREVSRDGERDLASLSSLASRVSFSVVFFAEVRPLVSVLAVLCGRGEADGVPVLDAAVSLPLIRSLKDLGPGLPEAAVPSGTPTSCKTMEISFS